MGIFSAQQIFSDDQAITATAVSTNVINLGAPGTPYGAAAPLNRDIGDGTDVPILIQVTEAFDNLTSLKIAIEVDDDDDLSSSTVVIEKTVLLADLVAGYQFPIHVLPHDITERYLGLRYTVVGTAPTAGKITAGITMGNQSNVTGA